MPMTSCVGEEELAVLRQEREVEGLTYREIGARHFVSAPQVYYLLYGRARRQRGRRRRTTRTQHKVPKQCPECGRQFKAHGLRRYCSTRCKEQWRVSHRPYRSRHSPCGWCGTVFVWPRRARYAKFCSLDCRRLAENARNRAAWVPKNAPQRVCAQCGAAFMGKRHQRYCNSRCRNRAAAERRKEQTG